MLSLSTKHFFCPELSHLVTPTIVSVLVSLEIRAQCMQTLLVRFGHVQLFVDHSLTPCPDEGTPLTDSERPSFQARRFWTAFGHQTRCHCDRPEECLGQNSRKTMEYLSLGYDNCTSQIRSATDNTRTI